MHKGSWHLKTRVQNDLKCSHSKHHIDYVPAITFYDDIDVEIKLLGKGQSELEIDIHKADIKIVKYSDSHIGHIHPKEINFNFSVLSNLGKSLVKLVAGKFINLNYVLQKYFGVTFIQFHKLSIHVRDSYTEFLVSPKFSFDKSLLEIINTELEKLIQKYFKDTEESLNG